MSRLATTSFALVLTGCLAADGAGDEGMYIDKAVAATDDCSFTSSESEAFIGHGLITVGSPSAYRLIPQLRSRIIAGAGQELQKTIQVQGARVNLEFADAAVGALVDADQKQFQSLFSAPLGPNTSVTDIRIDALPEGALAAMAAAATDPNWETQVIAKIVAFGDLAGDEVVSQEFRFPITVCNNCITNVLVSTEGTALACPVPANTAVRAGNACNQFQDGVVDCCTGANGLVCPAPKAPPT